MPIEDQIPEQPAVSEVELRQEHRDLLRLLRAAINGEIPADSPSQTLRQTCWTKVLDLARLHQVDHFLYPVVASWKQEFQPPDDLMARWRTAFFGAVADYARAAEQLKELLEALHRDQVRVIPLKGAWLAENVYEDGACRPMCDFDLLVPLDELDRARAVFEGLGYTTSDHYMSIDRDKDIHYQHPEHPMMVELHWRIWHEGKTNVVAPDTDRLWTRLHEETLHGIPVLAFPPERQLVYLAQHILHHSLTIPLKAYLDLILLSRRYGDHLDPVILEKEACFMKIPFGALFVLQVALDIGAELPPTELATYLTATDYENERTAAISNILNITGKSAEITPALESSQQATAMHRIRMGLSRIFLPADHIRRAYSKSVKRYGLIGGYITRIRDLIRRRGKDFTNPAKPGDIENYKTRRNLSKWIQERDHTIHARYSV